jgi:hypothetical protein
MFSQQRVLRTFATALVVGCAGAGPALARPADVGPKVDHSTSSVSGQLQSAPLRTDAQSGYAFSRASGALSTPTTIDRRSPDAIDVAAGRTFHAAPSVEVVHVGGGSSGFDWGDAGIGAGGAAALALLALGGAMMVTHRRRPGVKPPGPSALAR